jgi:S1-C subfamily serine protease
MLLDTQGHILTNNHVVTINNAPAASIQVELPNGDTVPAQLTGRDPATDLAVVQIGAGDSTELKPVHWASPSSIVVGEPVVAIGYAHDLGGEPTVTSGVMSALNREFGDQTQTISGAIQTDAAINPGNSGGPLFDWSEQVIGVNSAGLLGTRQAPAQGLNFAVSVETAQPVAAALIAHGAVSRGYLGLEALTVSARSGKSSSLPVSGGAGVTQVTPGSPADQAGLQPGDIITKIGSVAVGNAGDLTTALTQYGPGMSVAVEYVRKNQPQTAQVTLGQSPAN